MPIPNRKDNIEKLSTKERVYNVLREWIADGTLQPQERLNDKELAAHFSVSRTPVREALQMLIEQKFVTVRPSSGTFVAPLDREDMACVYQMIAGLQCMALELAFSRIGAAEISRLRVLNAALMQMDAAGNVKETSRADMDFHRQFAILSGNSYLVRFTDTLLMQAQRAENLFFGAERRGTLSAGQHMAIIDAIERRDLNAAKETMRVNWNAWFRDADETSRPYPDAGE